MSLKRHSLPQALQMSPTSPISPGGMSGSNRRPSGMSGRKSSGTPAVQQAQALSPRPSEAAFPDRGYAKPDRSTTSLDGVSEASTLQPAFPSQPRESDIARRKSEIDRQLLRAACGSMRSGLAGSSQGMILSGSRRSWTSDEDEEGERRLRKKFTYKRLVCYQWLERKVWIRVKRWLMDHFLPVRITRSRHRRMSQLGELESKVMKGGSGRGTTFSNVGSQLNTEATNLGGLSGQSYWQALELLKVLTIQSAIIGFGASSFEMVILGLDYLRTQFCRCNEVSKKGLVNVVSDPLLFPWVDLGMDIFPIPYLVWMVFACTLTFLMMKFRPWPDDLQHGPHNTARESLGTGKRVPLVTCGIPKVAYTMLHCGLLGGCLGYQEGFLVLSTAIAGHLHAEYFYRDYSYLKLEYPILASCSMVATYAATFRNPLIGVIYGLEGFQEIFVIGLGTICFLWSSCVASLISFLWEAILKDLILGEHNWRELISVTHIYKSIKMGLMFNSDLDVDLNDVDPLLICFLLILPILSARVCSSGQSLVLKIRERVSSEWDMESPAQAVFATGAIWLMGLFVVYFSSLVLGDDDYDTSTTNSGSGTVSFAPGSGVSSSVVSSATSVESSAVFGGGATKSFEQISGVGGRKVISSNEVIATWNSGWKLLQESCTNAWFLNEAPVWVWFFTLIGRVFGFGVSLIFLEELGGLIIPSLVVGSSFAITLCRFLMAILLIYQDVDVGVQSGSYAITNLIDVNSPFTVFKATQNAVTNDDPSSIKLKHDIAELKVESLDINGGNATWSKNNSACKVHDERLGFTEEFTIGSGNTNAGLSGKMRIHGSALGAAANLDGTINYPLRMLLSNQSSNGWGSSGSSSNSEKAVLKDVSSIGTCFGSSCAENFTSFIDIGEKDYMVQDFVSPSSVLSQSLDAKSETYLSNLKGSSLETDSILSMSNEGQQNQQNKHRANDVQQIELKAGPFYDKDVMLLRFASLVGMVCFLTGTTRLPMFSLILVVTNYKRIGLDVGILRNVGYIKDPSPPQPPSNLSTTTQSSPPISASESTGAPASSSSVDQTILITTPFDTNLQFRIDTLLLMEGKTHLKALNDTSGNSIPSSSATSTASSSGDIAGIFDLVGKKINGQARVHLSAQNRTGSDFEVPKDLQNGVKKSSEIVMKVHANAKTTFLASQISGMVQQRTISDYDPNDNLEQATKSLFTSNNVRTVDENGHEVAGHQNEWGFMYFFLRDEWRYCFFCYAVTVTFMLCYIGDEESISERIAEQEGIDMLMLQYQTLLHKPTNFALKLEAEASRPSSKPTNSQDLLANRLSQVSNRKPSFLVGMGSNQGSRSNSVSITTPVQDQQEKILEIMGDIVKNPQTAGFDAFMRRHTHGFTTNYYEEDDEEAEEGDVRLPGGAPGLPGSLSRQVSKGSSTSKTLNINSRHARLQQSLFGPRRHTIDGPDLLGVIQEEKDEGEYVVGTKTKEGVSPVPGAPTAVRIPSKEKITAALLGGSPSPFRSNSSKDRIQRKLDAETALKPLGGASSSPTTAPTGMAASSGNAGSGVAQTSEKTVPFNFSEMPKKDSNGKPLHGAVVSTQAGPGGAPGALISNQEVSDPQPMQQQATLQSKASSLDSAGRLNFVTSPSSPLSPSFTSRSSNYNSSPLTQPPLALSGILKERESSSPGSAAGPSPPTGPSAAGPSSPTGPSLTGPSPGDSAGKLLPFAAPFPRFSTSISSTPDRTLAELEEELINCVQSTNPGSSQKLMESLTKKISDLKYHQMKSLVKAVDNAPPVRNVVAARNRTQMTTLLADILDSKRYSYNLSLADKMTEVLVQETGSVHEQSTIHEMCLRFLENDLEKAMENVSEGEDP